MKKIPYRCALTVSVLAALGAVATAHAQSAPAGEAVQLEEVNVTAQRREEQLQKTPMSLTVIAGEQLDRMQITRLDDIKFVTPNIIIEQNTGTSSGAKIIMRGVGAEAAVRQLRAITGQKNSNGPRKRTRTTTNTMATGT